ncbi:MAG: fasciclin domain-containing protein [Chloroflexi bacterium]|jgi:hypothetical protein|nr:fasciclin domain-containing protein [Chloroflexota bacterium]
MKVRRTIVSLLGAAVLVTAIAAPVAAAPAAQGAKSAPVPAAPAPAGSILALLEADGTAFDRDWYDFDILEAAGRTVLGAKPGSPVAAITVPNAGITVFAPNDRAFQLLALSLTGKWSWTEEAVVNSLVTALGASAVDTLETVLRYHVIPGKVDFATATSISGTPVATDLGPTITPRFVPWLNTLVLRDQDPNAADPWVVNSKRDIPVGTNSMVHGISLVLRFTDL